MITKIKRHVSPLLLTFSIIYLLLQSSAMGAVIFTESFGTVSATTAIAAHETANDFDNDGFTFSGTGDIRLTGPSDYSGASGGANAFLTNNAAKIIMISGISTIGHTAGTVDISFGAFKHTTASTMTTLIFEFSTDAAIWTPITIPAQPAGTNTANWRALSFQNTIIPISPTLSLRWTNSDATTQYRIDDVILTALPEPSVAILGALGLLGLLRRRR